MKPVFTDDDVTYHLGRSVPEWQLGRLVNLELTMNSKDKNFHFGNKIDYNNISMLNTCIQLKVIRNNNFLVVISWFLVVISRLALHTTRYRPIMHRKTDRQTNPMESI